MTLQRGKEVKMELTNNDAPKPIETEIEQALNRVRQTYESSDHLREPRPVEEERAVFAAAKLIERKFPIGTLRIFLKCTAEDLKWRASLQGAS